MAARPPHVSCSVKVFDIVDQPVCEAVNVAVDPVLVEL
jgi:hypothetical protein